MGSSPCGEFTEDYDAVKNVRANLTDAGLLENL